MIYPSIRIEGAILSPDILDRVEDLPGQKPADFGLDSSTKVKDEIARAWADAQDYWRIFQRKLEALRPESPATTETRQQWVTPLLGLLGYQLEYHARGEELNGKLYAISHRVINRGNVPAHIVGYREEAKLDRKTPTSRMSAHALVQEYLNLSDQLFGVVTNGSVLRLLRDSSRLIKQSFVEFDLDRIFTDGLFADFAVLYRLAHATRLPLSSEASAECWLEKYHQEALDSGARIREGLSKAVETAILAFANGFVAHRDNEALRALIIGKRLEADEFYKNLLRLIYRLLFLMVIEERDLVFPVESKSCRQRDTYRDFYSVQRLRRLSEKRYLADPRKHDLWLSLLATFRLFEANGPGARLGIGPLAGDLFGRDAIGNLSSCTLGNDVLLGCLRALSVYEHPETRQQMRVNYAALNVEEFGSVYEGLLEYAPIFEIDGTRVSFQFAAGDERSRTGSHYTPDDLVQPLVKHSLDYLIADRLKSDNPEAALLDLRVADIACGSGHILLAAARRIATELAIVRTGEEQPSPTAYRTALRDAIRNCIYGVDYNPLAVELCKVALWLEAHVPGQPLNFLDHHIKCGNSIVGFVRREELDRGVPDEAFATMPGDDREIASDLRAKNRRERKDREKGQHQLGPTVKTRLNEYAIRWDELSKLPERTPEEIERKKAAFHTLSTGVEAFTLEQIAAIPVAQFYVPKTESTLKKMVTDAEFRRYWEHGNLPQGEGAALAWATAGQKRVFHWFLEFPHVVARGGFDCILGNPPYLGGQALSGTFGSSFCEYAKYTFAPAGLHNLVVFFFRRVFDLMRADGYSALITTETIKDGDNRRTGLEVAVRAGASIIMAVRSTRWPGAAQLFVSLLALKKGPFHGLRLLDGTVVDMISSRLDADGQEQDAYPLAANAARMFQGVIFLGDGFIVTEPQAAAFIAENPKNADVLMRVSNGDEINNHPDQHPGRWIINLGDRSEAEAAHYSAPFRHLEQNVKPVRQRDKRALYRERWWQYAERRPGLFSALKSMTSCFVTAQTTKYLNFSSAPTSTVFLQTSFVFASCGWSEFSAVQSTIHEVWVRKRVRPRESRLTYSPSECFQTFPFPSCPPEVVEALEEIGQRYDEHRKSLMLSLWLGLTDIYNLFHARDLTPALVQKKSKKSAEEAEHGYEGLLELRRLHVELDLAVRDAYGWHDLDLGHDFHEVDTLPENDRTRYTISPTARKEVLRRLLALNHERAAEEAATGATKSKGTKTRKGVGAAEGQSSLVE